MEIMICFWVLFIIWACTGLGGAQAQAQQFYDPGDCSENTTLPGSQYTCSNAIQKSCQTFMVYRASQQFQTISNISGLFQIDQDVLLQLNNLTSSLETLKSGREVLVPINCSCSGRFFEANFSYSVLKTTTFSEIACGVFESLLKSMTLVDENPSQGTNFIKVGTKLHVPLKCACPDNFTSGIKYLVTYPFIEGDGTTTLGKKFGIPPEYIWEANHLEPLSTVYPNTTILVPLKTNPVINFDVSDSQPPLPGFLPTFPIEKTAKSSTLKTLYIAGPIIGFFLVAMALLACGFYLKVYKKWKKNEKKIQSFTARSSLISCSMARSSTNSCLSPEILVGLKYSLSSYSTEELKKATGDFDVNNNKIDDHVYKGMINNVEVMIKRLRFDDTRQIIDLHSKINHINIVKLLGVCYGGETDLACWSYLVFEFPRKGSLRDCLSNTSSPLQWHRRTQIAFDIATGLHYLHYCTFPTYTHTSLNSRNIFVTVNWRAKLTIFGGITTDLGSSRRHENGASVTGWVAPEYHLDGLISEKVDIFAFGVVLLELISAREDMDDGRLFRDSTGFLGGGGASEGGCFEQLRHFMDPCLKEDYPLAEALCLAVLAKACVGDDPLHRPSMDDIMKVLARMV